MGVDDGGHAIFHGDVVDERVNDEAGFRVEAAVGLVAEQVFGIQGYGTCDGHALLHTARDFIGEFLFGTFQVDALQALFCAVLAVSQRHVGEHVEREHHVFEHGHAVEEGSRLEYHAHLAAQQHLLFLVHGHEVATVVEYLAAGGLQQPYDAFHEHRLARPRLSDDEVCLALREAG